MRRVTQKLFADVIQFVAAQLLAGFYVLKQVHLQPTVHGEFADLVLAHSRGRHVARRKFACLKQEAAEVVKA
jgi:hypothetical protein